MRAPRTALVLAIVAAVLAGCAGIPTSGPVERVQDESGLGESTVRYTPAGPAPDATEAQVVRGFLDAMLAYPVTHRVAAEYLTPEAADRWRPGQSTTVYTAADVSSDAVGAGRIDLAADVRLDAQGRLTRVAAARQWDLDLQRIDGQWRIATPPDGVLVSRDWFEDYVRTFDLYFLDESGSHLVPVPVHEVVGDQLATSLMTSLAIGPRPGSAPGLRTAVPPVQDLRASVPVVDGVAQIEFSTRVGDLTPAVQKQLSAQVAWTLRQVPVVTDVQITGDGTVVAPAGEPVQDADGWTSFGPDKSRRWATVVAGGAVHRVGPRSRERLSGDWGADDAGASMVAADEERVVATWRDRARVTAADGADPVEITGERFLRPILDIDENAWLVDRPAGRTRVRVHDGESFVGVPAPELPGISSFAISPDGARYAATADGRLFVGGVERRDGRVVGLTGATRLATVAGARQVVWVDGSRVAHLGPPGSQVHSLRIDGTEAVEAWPGGGQLLPDIQPVALVATAAADSDLYLLDSEGGVWILDRTRWVAVDVAVARGIA